MFWFFIALLSPALHGMANVFDNYLTNKLLKNAWTLTFYSTLFNALFLPLVWLIEKPGWLPLNLWPACLLIGLIEIVYLYPYYKALHSDDTSIVSSLFDVGKIFIPILAFFLVGERLGWSQYVGFAVLTVASVALTIEHHKKFELNKAFFYMLGCSLLLSLEVVVYKYVFEQVSWSTGFVWPALISFAMALFFLILPRQRQSIKRQLKRFDGIAPIFIFQELLSFGGSAAATYAVALVPVTLEESVDSFQPFFVLLYAIAFRRFFPKLFKEHIDGRSVRKKVLLFCVMAAGVYLVVRGGLR